MRARMHHDHGQGVQVNIPRIFASAVIRKVAYWVAALLIAAVVSLTGLGEARASGQDNSCDATAKGCTPQQAYTACLHTIEWYASLAPSTRTNPRCEQDQDPATAPAGRWIGKFGQNNGYNSAFWGQQCPAGTTWDGASKTCFNPADCLAKSNLTNKKMTGGTGNACSAGCEFTTTDSLQIGFPGSGPNGETTWYASKLVPSGNACAAGTPSPQALSEAVQDCKPVGTLTQCIKANGQHCTKVSGTREVCWKPGETGLKTDGPSAVVRQAGTNPPAAPTPPPGETYDQQGNPTTVTTTQPGKPNSTTTQNVFVTTNGTNAGGSGGGDSGEPGDGTGGEGQGEGTAAGGTSCEDPPIVSGDEPLRMVATQAWATRCAIEAGNAVTTTGDIGDCQATFTVEGTGPHVETLKAKRAQICGDASQIAAADVFLAGEEGKDNGFFASEGPAPSFDLSRVAFGSGCPALPAVSIGGVVWSPPGAFCDLIGLLRLLFIAVATLWGVRIVASE